MSDIDESEVRIAIEKQRQFGINGENDGEKGKSGALIRRSMDEGFAIWYIFHYGINDIPIGITGRSVEKGSFL